MRDRFIDQFDVILFDMGRTFMFNVDRFSDSENYGETYRQSGGNELSDKRVQQIISTLFNNMMHDYKDPAFMTCFPSVQNYLKKLSDVKQLPQEELKLLGHVFAKHEIGTISEKHADVLNRLHKTHKLGVISNIWSKSDYYVEKFKEVGIYHLFDIIVFSADYGHIKPSPLLFKKAIEAFAVACHKMVYVGDNLKRDVVATKVLGLSAIWLDIGRSSLDEIDIRPDLIIHDIEELLSK